MTDKQNGQRGRNPAGRHNKGNHHQSDYTTADAVLYSVGTEQAALAAVMEEPPTLSILRQYLQPEDFGGPLDRAVYIEMCALADKGVPHDDEVALIKALERAGVSTDEARSRLYELRMGGVGGVSLRARQYCLDILSYAERRVRAELQLLNGEAYLRDYDSASVADREAPLHVRLDSIRARIAGGHLNTAVSTSLADVEEEEIDWLWWGRLARRKAALLDGDPGVGKGLTITEIIASLTTGRPLPGDTARRSPMDVLLLSPEDGSADTIKPRLRVAGADMARVHVLSTYHDAHGVERDVTFPSAAPIIEAEARRVNACLLVIDPIMACLDGGVKTSDDTQVRAALRPLVHACEASNMALLMVRHMNKSGDGKALYRGGGSIAFTGLARILMLMTEHPDDAGGGDKRIALAVSKINLVKTPPTLGLTIRPSDNPDMPPRVLWDDEPLHFTADELLSATNTKQSGERRAIVRAIAEAGRPLALIEIAHAVEVDEKDTVAYGALRQRLMRMERAGQIVRVDRAVYGLPSSSNHNNTNNNNKHNNRNKHNKPFVTIVTDVMPVTEDADVTNHHDQRAELLTLAESLDWPRIPIAPAQNIGGTPDTWATFAGGASNGHIDSALRSLRFRAHGQEGA